MSSKYIGKITSISRGSKGPYAIVDVSEIKGSVTFSVTKEVWKEECRPEQGQYVVLEKLEDKGAGWRAKKARLKQPSDE